MQARASAPGKLMLFGEYAVLQGWPAVAMCLDRRISCEASATDDGRLRIASPGVFEPPVDLPIEVLDHDRPADPRLALLWPLLRPARILRGLALRFEAEFPPTWGLGSSTASSLAAGAALHLLLHPVEEVEWTDEEGLSAAGQDLLEQVLGAQESVQGAASGYDAATQMLGGCVAYRRSPSPQARRLALPVACSGQWLVAYTGTKAQTGEMIGQVRAGHPPEDPIYDAIGKLADTVVATMETQGEQFLGGWLNLGHGLLADLGAVPEAIHRKVQYLSRCPCILGLRLSGAGGGDCLLALARDLEEAKAAFQAQGFEVLPLQPESEGLRFDA